MPNPNDKLFQEWVRQTLHNYQPEYNPKDWERMQGKLRKHWWNPGVIGLVCLLMSMIVGWWMIEAGNKEKPKAIMATFPQNLLPLISDSTAKLPKLASSLVAKRGSGQDKIRLPVTNPNPERLVISSLVLSRKLFMANNLHTNSENQLSKLATPLLYPEQAAIRHQMLTGEFGSDSTSYQVFTRNLQRWPNSVIICDLTTSMYPYSTQLFAWFKQYARHPAIKGIIFFTDCDSLGRETRTNGLPGQMFVVQEGEITKALPVMLKAAANTLNNRDDAENDIEAILFAQRTFPEAKHVILLADNSSGIKDIALLEQIKKPVHVVLCGTTKDSTQAFQPDYYTLAKHTQGSLHTLKDDLLPHKITSQTWLRVGHRYYRYNSRKDNFKLTRFRHRPNHFLGLFWF